MKIRIGIGVAGEALSSARLADLVDGIDIAGFDSIWLSEVLTAEVVDPLAGLAWAGAHHPRIKLGTTMLLPGRNVFHLAKQLATLDHLSDGRLLVTLVPGLVTEPERSAIGVPPTARGAVFDDAIPQLRRLWAGDAVTIRGTTGEPVEVALALLPAQQPLELWLGGMAPESLERCGRLSDGWLPALCTPMEAADGRIVVEEAAGRAGRSISPEHFGVSLGYSQIPLSERAAAAIERRGRGHRAAELVPVGTRALREQIEQFVAVGFSKFVVRPLQAPESWRDELDALADAIGDLQT